MAHTFDLDNPVNWLLVGAGVGAIALFTLGLILVFLHERKYNTTTKRFWYRRTHRDMASLSRADHVFFALLGVVVTGLMGYLVLGFLTGTPLV